MTSLALGLLLAAPSFGWADSASLSAGVFTATPQAPAISAADDAEAKRWSITPYFWAPEIEGAITVRGNRASGLVPFSDILDQLDLAALVHVERAGDDWSILLDTVSMWLSQDLDGPLDAEIELTLVTTELASAYRLADFDEQLGVPVTLDGLVGMRYVYYELDLDTNAGASREVNDDFLDPIVGARSQWRITEGFWLGARADVGGFSIGSKLSWQLIGTLGWDPAEWLSVIGGYRLLDIDYTKDTGLTESGMDLQFRGPMLGVMFRF